MGNLGDGMKRVIASVALAVLPAWAGTTLPVPAPKDVVLTIAGKVQSPNQGTEAVFSMAMLTELPQTTFTTKQTWYPDKVVYTGPLLRDVLAAAGAKGTRIMAIALDGYKSELPFDDAFQHNVIVARLRDGKPMPIRDRGPLFIVYPQLDKPELQSQMYNNRSVWQLKRLEVD